MSESLFLLREGNALTKMSVAPFESEDIFQKLLAQFPDLLTDAEFGEGTPRRWILVRREAGVPDRDGGLDRWSLDHLFLDQDGVPTLVEVKRATDTRARREVVAQMLDYASNAGRHWKVGDLMNWFEESCSEDDVSTQERLARLLATETPDMEAFWKSVETNLSDGRVRLVFVADRIAPELERIVVFLNEQMKSATVVALELRSFASGVDRILSPRLIGVTPRAVARKSVLDAPAARSVDEWMESVLEDDADVRERVRRFVDAMRALGAVARLTGSGKTLVLEFQAKAMPVRGVYIWRSGRVEIWVADFQKAPAFNSDKARIELREEFKRLGFPSLSKGPNPVFDLPRMGDNDAWRRLEGFFMDVCRKLSES